MKKQPFKTNRLSEVEKYFTRRQQEVINLFKSGENFAINFPRRIGMSTLRRKLKEDRMSELKHGFDLKVIKQWEYLELNVDTDKRFTGHGESRLVSDVGRDGWELVTVIPQMYYEPGVHGASPERWIFKRELITEG